MQSLIIPTLAIVSTTLAQYAYTNASAPFSLVIKSAANERYVGHELLPCHEGAGIDALCLGQFDTSSTPPMFTFNSTDYNLENPPPYGEGPGGILVYNLPTQGGNISVPLSVFTNLNGNVAVPLFYPGTAPTILGFNNEDYLNVQDYGGVPDPARASYDWLLCSTNLGYPYITLAYLTIHGETPSDPSCSSIRIIRYYK
ncbi:hypothetical protein F5884DRAFT_782732 [Xylogone sp. PMI_703]|nr:hypothetical protein F5884DRAFT_782732 [Xylogone sp. PMI_703]